jgi:uncharacterized membrane protein
MVRIEGEILINRPAEEVFDCVADERNEPRYNPKMRSAELISDGPIGVGTRFRAETASMGRIIDMVIEFTGFERRRRIQETVHMSSMDLQGAVNFDPFPEATRMRWVVGGRAARHPQGDEAVGRLDGPAPGAEDLDQPQASLGGQVADVGSSARS